MILKNLDSSVVAITCAVGVGCGLIAMFFAKRKVNQFFSESTESVIITLVDRQMLTNDTMHLWFKLPCSNRTLGLPVGNYVLLSQSSTDILAARPYTPISKSNQLGTVEFIIKVYFGGQNDKFPAGGTMSQLLHALPIGSNLYIQGPMGNLQYKGKGTFAIRPDAKSAAVESVFKHVNMICGGSGITPMYQLIRHILDDPDDHTKIAIVYANKTEKDIVLRDIIDSLADENPLRFHRWYTVSNSSRDWPFSIGHISESILNENLLPPSDESIVLLSGPDSMVEIACPPLLASLGYTYDKIFTF